MTDTRTVLQRLVTPMHPDHRALYLDDVPEVEDRHRITVPTGTTTELATWFNAFPASWWTQTDLTSVALDIEVTAPADLHLRASDGAAVLRTLERRLLRPGRTILQVDLGQFAAGGWVWPVLTAAGQPVGVEMTWSAAVAKRRGTVTVAVPTFDRREACLDQLRALASSPETMRLVDEVVVVDQGTQPLLGHESARDVVEMLGDRLRVVRQANAGGSGGYARCLREAQRARRSRYALLMDDDALVEPDGINRAVAFADACSMPTIVGGHMFDTAHPTRLYRLAEVLDRRRFTWASAPGTAMNHDLATSPLQSTSWLHRPPPTDFAAWFMCLVPLEVLERIGLPLPLFIKWDDAELGLRAGEAGVRTTVLPGAAVWHEAWTHKGAETGWQAYFLLRNRLVTAMLHSRWGGLLLLEWLVVQLRHVWRGERDAVTLRELAVLDVLSGPSWLHRDLIDARADVARRSCERMSEMPRGWRLAAVGMALGLAAALPVRWRRLLCDYRAASLGNVTAETWDGTLARASRDGGTEASG